MKENGKDQIKFVPVSKYKTFRASTFVNSNEKKDVDAKEADKNETAYLQKGERMQRINLM